MHPAVKFLVIAGIVGLGGTAIYLLAFRKEAAAPLAVATAVPSPDVTLSPPTPTIEASPAPTATPAPTQSATPLPSGSTPYPKPTAYPAPKQPTPYPKPVQPTPYPTPTPNPTPSSTATLNVTRSATTCSTGALRVVPASQSAAYQAGQPYSTVDLGSGSTAEVAPSGSAGLVYVIDAAGTACLAGYQQPGTAPFSVDLQSTADVVAYPATPGVGSYELSERTRRLRSLTAYGSLKSFLDGALKNGTLSSLGTNPTYMDRIRDTTNEYDQRYPNGF